MTNFNFTCRYCGNHSTVTEPNFYSNWNYLSLSSSPTCGDVGLKVLAITCPNSNCRKLSLDIHLHPAHPTHPSHGKDSNREILKKWKLLPESEAKVLPDFIPVAITEDYYEACRIKDLSPKASATLSRRCLQGMIRDFFKISKKTLWDEIVSLEGKLESETWEAIDAVRKIGNIGAHMEKDIDLIIDVDPDEAQILIELIEQLIEEWYVARNLRQKRSSKIREISDKKQQQRQALKSVE